MKGYPRYFLRALLTVFGLLAGSGLLLMPTALDVRFGWDVPWRLAGGERVLTAAIHCTAALLMCAFLGALWSLHMRLGWRTRRHLVSGLLATAILGGAALTSVGIYYLGDENLLLTASAGHMAFGITATATTVVHVFNGLRVRAWPIARRAVRSVGIAAARHSRASRYRPLSRP